MNIIKFSRNWNNKLNNNIFTTIRKYSDEKYEYYLNQLNKQFYVELNKKMTCIVKLLEVTPSNYLDISLTMLRLDTGIIDNNNIDDIFKIFGIKENDKVLILTFAKI